VTEQPVLCSGASRVPPVACHTVRGPVSGGYQRHADLGKSAALAMASKRHFAPARARGLPVRAVAAGTGLAGDIRRTLTLSWH
jgi:hypothetical protein